MAEPLRPSATLPTVQSGTTPPTRPFRDNTRLIVAGIRTEQCCETTTRHASDEGWAVDFVAEATFTTAMRTPSGQSMRASRRWLASLAAAPALSAAMSRSRSDAIPVEVSMVQSSRRALPGL